MATMPQPRHSTKQRIAAGDVFCFNQSSSGSKYKVIPSLLCHFTVDCRKGCDLKTALYRPKQSSVAEICRCPITCVEPRRRTTPRNGELKHPLMRAKTLTAFIALTLAFLISLEIFRACAAEGPPVIISHPQSQTASVAGSVTFSVTVDGSTSFSYQWRKVGLIISGTSASSYSITGLQVTNSGSYTVESTPVPLSH